MTQQLRIGHEPIQRPGKSKQDYGTPMALIRAIEKRFGTLTIDLAATAETAKAPRFITPEQDSFKQDWHTLIGNGIGWLNPPFADIEPWARKCRCETIGERTCSILMLTPASIGSEWFAESCEDAAAVIGLRPRLTFEGCSDPYPKDCMLTVWGPIGEPLDHLSTWRWRQ